MARLTIVVTLNINVQGVGERVEEFYHLKVNQKPLELGEGQGHQGQNAHGGISSVVGGWEWGCTQINQWLCMPARARQRGNMRE